MSLTNTELKTSRIKHFSARLYVSLILSGMICITGFNPVSVSGQSPTVLQVSKTADFNVSGNGSSVFWTKTDWIELTQRTNLANDSGRKTFIKILYSKTGIYFLFRCEDDRITSTITSHFEELWREDVVEVFLWPNEGQEVYFEYELSPLNYELPILVSKTDSGQSHWIPFEYSYKDGDARKTIHKTSSAGGEMKSGAAITEWRAEFFIPFELLTPLKNAVPKSGTAWRANFYRVDYDHGSTNWTWQPVTTNFHDIYNYGTLVFE